MEYQERLDGHPLEPQLHGTGMVQTVRKYL